MPLHEEQSGRFLRRPKQDHPAATVAGFCTAVLIFLAGEVFFPIRMRRAADGLTVPLQLQMLPSQMLPLHETGIAVNGNAFRQGIEFDRIGRRVAYHFLRRHPSDSTVPGPAGEVVRVAASEVILVIDPVEGGQLRGVSKLAPAIVKLSPPKAD